MTRYLLVYVLMQACVFAQLSKTASISGVVREASTGTSLADVKVHMDRGSRIGVTVTTDSYGRFSFPSVEPGQHRVTAEGRSGSIGFPRSVTKIITAIEGESMENLQFSIATNAEISGKVVDQNKEPIAGARVILIAREYSLGELRYVYAGLAMADDEGEYVLSVPPGRAYLVMAQKVALRLNAISDAPAEIKLRKPAYVTTFYPGVPTLDAALPITLRPGEERDGVDLRVLRSPSYCVEAIAQQGSGAGELRFSITDRQPTSGASGDGAMFVMAPNGKTGPDGKIRACGLHPGSYVLAVHSDPMGKSAFYGTTEFTIADRDVKNVVAAARPAIAIAGEVVWHGSAPDPPMKEQVSLYLQPMTRAQFMNEPSTSARVSLPGTFAWSAVFVDSYWLRYNGLPKGVHVKEMTYAGQNLLAEPLRAGGSGVGENLLRVVLARDGGTIAARVADKEGNAVGDSRVLIMPVSIASEAALAAAIVSGQCDQSGAWTSNSLSPGKYYTVALEQPHDNSPESISKLWAMRTKFKEVELGSGANAEVVLTPVALQ